MWKAGLFLLCFCWSLLSSFADAQPWCPVQIGTAKWVSTGPAPGFKASTQAVSSANDPGYPSPLWAGVYNMDRAAMSALFGSDYCIDGIGTGGGCITDAQPERVMMEADLTAEDNLCPNPIKHTMTFSGHFLLDTSRIKGGAERTECGLGKADNHGHCVVNSCAAGVLAAAGTYSLGMSQTNTVTSSCLIVNGHPCEVSFQSSGAVTRRLVAGQTNYFQGGRYVETGNLCTTNAGPTPTALSSVPSDTCASGFSVYNDPATGIARCVVPGTGTPTPGDGTGAGAGSGWPSSCPSWLSSICSWFADTNSSVEAVGASKGSTITADEAAPQTFGDPTTITMSGNSWWSNSSLNLPNTCPANPEVALPGGRTLHIPFEQVCNIADGVHPIAAMLGYLIALGIALSGRSSS